MPKSAARERDTYQLRHELNGVAVIVSMDSRGLACPDGSFAKHPRVMQHILDADAILLTHAHQLVDEVRARG